MWMSRAVGHARLVHADELPRMVRQVDIVPPAEATQLVPIDDKAGELRASPAARE